MSGRIPTPVVLAAASAMVCVGVIGYWLATRAPTPEPASRGPNDLVVDGSSPERAAESFLDAWRKRAHGAARELSVGSAREAVEDREQRDEHMSADERAVKEQVWDAMATSRLGLQIAESENLDDGRIVLRGTAEGTFLERPYAREVAFVLRPVEDQWRVEQIDFGEILSDVPDGLDLGPVSDPSEFEMRGEDVP